MKLGKENRNQAKDHDHPGESTTPQELNRLFAQARLEKKVPPGAELTNLRTDADRDVHVARREAVSRVGEARVVGSAVAKRVPLNKPSAEAKPKPKGETILRQALPVRSSSLPQPVAGKKGGG